MNLEAFLERPERAPFYDLLGGLADNLLTIGNHAGTFMACSGCGDTFSLKGESWKCDCCGRTYELKFTTPAERGDPFQTEVRVSGLSKARMNPHWYFDNENWSVAELLTQILRLNPEEFLSRWLRHLGVALAEGPLESVLCWPRFKFGGKTIQPDLAIGFRNDVILVEFKRPSGGTVPPEELLGQMCFAECVASQLGRTWHLMLVPGPDLRTHVNTVYVASAHSAVEKATVKWQIPSGALDAIQRMPQPLLAERVTAVGWETLLKRTSEVILEHVPDSWAKKQALKKLAYFHQARIDLDLLSK